MLHVTNVYDLSPKKPGERSKPTCTSSCDVVCRVEKEIQDDTSRHSRRKTQSLDVLTNASILSLCAQMQTLDSSRLKMFASESGYTCLWLNILEKLGWVSSHVLLPTYKYNLIL